MARWRIAVGAGIVVALAVVAAFVVGSMVREEPEVAAAPVVAPASPSPTATVDPDPMPELHNTGEDFDQIIRSIEEFRNWLYRNPDPGLVDKIYHPECPCHAGVAERLDILRRDGVRFSESRSLIHEVVVLDREPGIAALKVVDQGLPSTVVDARSGEVVDSDSGAERKAYRFLLIESDHGWLVKDIRPAALDLDVPDESRS